MLQGRKQIIAVVAVILLASVLLCGIRTLADDEKIRQELASLYAKADEAIRKKDLKAISDLLTDDFTAKDSDGSVLDRKQFEARFSDALGKLKETSSVTTSIDNLKMIDGDAVVEITQTLKAKAMGSDGKEHDLVAVGKSRDTWTHTARGWLNKHSEDLGQTLTVDGESVE
jgi:ketosteroid isomerase-like protein